MIGRLVTALFWAAIFFALGAWSGGSLQPVGAAITRGAKAIGHGAREAWNWAFYEGQGAGVHDGALAEPGSDAGAASSSGHGLADLDGGSAADLAAARKAFAEGQVKEAIAGYRAFLVAHPADADAHGELGNVFYYNGQVGEAAGAYYSAALYLLADGRTDAASALVPAIRVGGPDLADDLQNRIAMAASAPVHAPAPATAPAPTETH